MSLGMTHNTTTSSETAISLSILPMHPTDWAEHRSSKPGADVYVDYQIAKGLQARVKYDSSDIANIFQTAPDISAANRSPIYRRGTKIFIPVTQRWTPPASAGDDAANWVFPVTGSLMLQLPNVPWLNEDDIRALIADVIGATYVATSSVLQRMLSGSTDVI